MAPVTLPTGRTAELPPPKSGIVGIVKLGGPANVELYEALLMLQHRGQDNAGMVTTNWSQECGYKEHKGHGMVKDVFDSKEQMALLEGSSGIAIVATCKPDENANASVQPLFVNSPLGMYMVHNGRVTNQEELEESVLGGTDAFIASGTEILVTSSAALLGPGLGDENAPPLIKPLGVYMVHNERVTNQEELEESVLGGTDALIARHLFTNSDTEVLLNVLADELHRARMRGYNTTGCDVNSKASQYEFLFEVRLFLHVRAPHFGGGAHPAFPGTAERHLSSGGGAPPMAILPASLTQSALFSTPIGQKTMRLGARGKGAEAGTVYSAGKEGMEAAIREARRQTLDNMQAWAGEMGTPTRGSSRMGDDSAMAESDGGAGGAAVATTPGATVGGANTPSKVEAAVADVSAVEARVLSKGTPSKVEAAVADVSAVEGRAVKGWFC
ncbi:hypothetical protein FOA52_012851 [Chlamydomonas sp. UWO 241]|nr:hypothetical protein FOA52_012851 [Chlamydomonas sp. UWO 241]